MGAETNAPTKPFSYGGQAVIEGVMMRGAHVAAIAVRNPQGDIVVHEQPLNAALYRGRVAKTPFVRGLVMLWDALGLGTRALLWSANVALEEEDKENATFDGPVGWGTLALSLSLAVGLFFILPTLTAGGVERAVSWALGGGADGAARAFIVNLLEGVVRLVFIIGYIWAIGRIPDVKRLFGYHGAEHKTINAYEAGAPLTPETVQQYPIEHPRCGTAFLLNVAVISVLVFALFGRPAWYWLILSRIVLIPVIAGIAYEVLRWTARHSSHPVVAFVIKPNLALQRLTTNPPTDDMVEVAITAFARVLAAEQRANMPVPQQPAVAAAD